MIEQSGREYLLGLLRDEKPWEIFKELADQDELKLSAILRPHDEASFIAARDSVAMEQRGRLDQALGGLTLVEIGYEIGLLQEGDAPAQEHAGLGNFRKLVMDSEAFFRYASAYLYFGVRLLAYRWFGPGWTDSRPPCGARGESTNRRLFPIAFPPPLVLVPPGKPEAGDGIFESFLNRQKNANWDVALGFLDGFHPGADREEERAGEEAYDKSPFQEPVQYELWLRGLLPNTERTQADRFQEISEGLVAWAQSRTEFYLALLQKTDFLAAGITLVKGQAQPLAEAVLTNPLTARFALADIYWLARILRAEVSTGASVSYARDSWLNLLCFKAGLDGETNFYLEVLKQYEETLRSVFNFVCDLVQNAVALSEQRECKHFNPEDYPKPWRWNWGEKRTKEWRAVFDEELREIDRQRSRRTYTPPTFQEGEPFAMNAEDADSYWSERLITGRQPHNRIGLCFSGGGIRSATFNLGVLQGLQELDLLRYMDYLSTVSGGGFIGSWLVGNVQRTRQWLGKATCWDESIAHLRSYSSYLAPVTGLLSADTWTLAASWARNAFLIQLTGVTWLFALLLGALGGRMLFLAFAEAYPRRGFDLALTWLRPGGVHLPYVGILAMVMGILVAGSLAYNFAANRVETGKHSPRASVIRWLAVLPCWVGAFAVAAILWSDARAWLHSPGNLHDYSFLLARAWQWLDVLLATHWIALLLIGLFALQPADSVDKASRAGASSAWSVWSWIITVWRSLWIGTLCLGVLYLGLCAILYLNLNWANPEDRFGSYAFVFGPALVLAAFALSVVLFIGLSGRTSNEAQREWWTRFGAWLLIYAAAGLAWAGVAVLGPRLVIKLFTSAHLWVRAISWSAVLGWLGTVISGLFAGNSSKTAGDGSTGTKLGLELLAKAGGLTFVLGATLSAATVLYLLLLNIASDHPAGAGYWQVLQGIDYWKFAAMLVVVVLCGTLFSWFFEINIFGLSQFYRNRLVRCYLGATRWAPGVRKPHSFTKFDFNDDMSLSQLKDDFRGPFPIFNCTLNLSGSADLTLHTRHSASFSLTPLRCGSDRPKVGYAPTGNSTLQGAKSSFAGGVKLGQAVAVSGAAASPNMGYNTSPLVALLLTMFNVRLGWWFPNPGQSSWTARGLRFSLYYLSRELLGIADETRHFLNVSDGGHFENLGVYELIRRRSKVIIACDAECDETLQFGGLGNLVRICATDFGAIIDLDVRSIRQQKEGHSLAHCAVGKIKYSNGSIGYLIYLKASITGDEDIGIAQYRSLHPSFPHETTANQFFSEDQFESYRKLGHHVVRHSFRGVQPGEEPLVVAVKLADVMASARTSGEAFLKHTRTLARLWEEFRKSPALHSFMDELMHIAPPIAVVPVAPGNAHEATEELCMALQLIQLMEDVFLDLQLEDFWEHPDNRGWAIIFMRWARSPRFRNCWNQTRRTFGIRFEYFCQARLGLERDTPIVRV